MNFKLLLFVCFVLLACLSVKIASADVTLYDDNFQASTSGALSGSGMLAAPTVGTSFATGGFIGTGGNRAYTTTSNGSTNNITTAAGSTFNDVGTAAGNFYTATLSSPADITGTLGTGATTSIDFEIASFGTNNQNNFKYTHVVGLSSTGDEVFSFSGEPEVAAELVSCSRVNLARTTRLLMPEGHSPQLTEYRSLTTLLSESTAQVPQFPRGWQSMSRSII